MAGLFKGPIEYVGKKATNYAAKKIAPDHFGKELFGKRLGKSWFTDTLNIDEVYYEKIAEDFGLEYDDARGEFWKNPEMYVNYYDDRESMDQALRERLDQNRRRRTKFEYP